ncbi:unnamed protein product [Caenorhabditis auriculariae]|uniref:C2H2-type domain-containing protein n=1 Tax=Caenorhabditis auriculariae TaxID=2777116 RepID=A0A8S1GRE3_9PELO|nr:unnamed protein product [Caenorhabditis auriculariae]
MMSCTDFYDIFDTLEWLRNLKSTVNDFKNEYKEVGIALRMCPLENRRKKSSERVSQQIKKLTSGLLIFHVLEKYEEAKKILEAFIATSEENEVISDLKMKAAEIMRTIENFYTIWRNSPKSDQIFEELENRKKLMEVIVEQLLPVFESVVKEKYSEEVATYSQDELREEGVLKVQAVSQQQTARETRKRAGSPEAGPSSKIPCHRREETGGVACLRSPRTRHYLFHYSADTSARCNPQIFSLFPIFCTLQVVKKTVRAETGNLFEESQAGSSGAELAEPTPVEERTAAPMEIPEASSEDREHVKEADVESKLSSAKTFRNPPLFEESEDAQGPSTSRLPEAIRATAAGPEEHGEASTSSVPAASVAPIQIGAVNLESHKKAVQKNAKEPSKPTRSPVPTRAAKATASKVFKRVAADGPVKPKPNRRYLTEGELRGVVSRYQNGIPIKDIAQQFGISVGKADENKPGEAPVQPKNKRGAPKKILAPVEDAENDEGNVDANGLEEAPSQQETEKERRAPKKRGPKPRRAAELAEAAPVEDGPDASENQPEAPVAEAEIDQAGPSTLPTAPVRKRKIQRKKRGDNLKVYREEQKKLKEAAKFEAVARARARAQAEARAQAQAEAEARARVQAEARAQARAVAEARAQAETLEQVSSTSEGIEEVAAVHDASEAGGSSSGGEGKVRDKRNLAPEEDDEGHPQLKRQRRNQNEEPLEDDVSSRQVERDLEREQEVGQAVFDYEHCRQGHSALVPRQQRQSSSSSGCGGENDGGFKNVVKVNEVVRNEKEGSETALVGCDTLQTSPDQDVLKKSNEVLENGAGDEKHGTQSCEEESCGEKYKQTVEEAAENGEKISPIKIVVGNAIENAENDDSLLVLEQVQEFDGLNEPMETLKYLRDGSDIAKRYDGAFREKMKLGLLEQSKKVLAKIMSWVEKKGEQGMRKLENKKGRKDKKKSRIVGRKEGKKENDDDDEDGEEEHQSVARREEVEQQGGQEGQEKEGKEQVVDRQPEGREEGELETSDDDDGEDVEQEEEEEREGRVVREEEGEKEMEVEEAQEQAVQEEREEQEVVEQGCEVVTGEDEEEPEVVAQPREEQQEEGNLGKLGEEHEQEREREKEREQGPSAAESGFLGLETGPPENEKSDRPQSSHAREAEGEEEEENLGHEEGPSSVGNGSLQLGKEFLEKNQPRYEAGGEEEGEDVPEKRDSSARNEQEKRMENEIQEKLPTRDGGEGRGGEAMEEEEGVEEAVGTGEGASSDGERSRHGNELLQKESNVPSDEAGGEDRERRSSLNGKDQQGVTEGEEQGNPQTREGEEEGAQNEPLELQNGLPEKSGSSRLSVGDGEKRQQGGEHEEEVVLEDEQVVEGGNREAVEEQGGEEQQQQQQQEKEGGGVEAVGEEDVDEEEDEQEVEEGSGEAMEKEVLVAVEQLLEAVEEQGGEEQQQQQQEKEGGGLEAVGEEDVDEEGDEEEDEEEVEGGSGEALEKEVLVAVEQLLEAVEELEVEQEVRAVDEVQNQQLQQGGHEEDVDVEAVEEEEGEAVRIEEGERPRLENGVQAIENNHPSDGARGEEEGQRGEATELPQIGQELMEEVEESEAPQSSDEEGSALTNMVPDEIEPEEVGNKGPVPSQSHDNGSPVSGYEELSNSGEVPPKNPLTRSSQVPANEVVSSPANSVHRSCSVLRDFEREKRQLATFSRDLGYECQPGPSYAYPTNTDFVQSYQRSVDRNAIDFFKQTGSFSTNAAGQGLVSGGSLATAAGLQEPMGNPRRRKSTPRKLISNNFDIDFLMTNHSVEEQAQERVPETSTPQVVKMKDGVAVLAQPRKQRNQPPRAVPLTLDQASSSGASSSRQPESVASLDDMPGGSGTFFNHVAKVENFTFETVRPVCALFSLVDFRKRRSCRIVVSACLRLSVPSPPSPGTVPLALDQASSSGASSSRQPQIVASPDDMPGGSGRFFDPVQQPWTVPLALDQASSSGASSSRQPQIVASPDDMPGGSGRFFDPVQQPWAVPLALDQASSSGASSSRQPQIVASPDDMPGGSGRFFDPVQQAIALLQPNGGLYQPGPAEETAPNWSFARESTRNGLFYYELPPSAQKTKKLEGPDDQRKRRQRVKKFACLICQKPYVDPTRIDQHSEKAHKVTDLSSLLGAFYDNQGMINRISDAVTQQAATAGFDNVAPLAYLPIAPYLPQIFPPNF